MATDINSKSEMAKNVADMKRDLPLAIEGQLIVAKITMAKFKALKAEGFTDEQALELCKGIG